MDIKENINIENWDNTNVHKTNAKNYEELYGEVQNELIEKLTIQNLILNNFLENNDLESAKHWANNVSKTTYNIIKKYRDFELNQYEKELHYLIVNFENDEINLEPYYFDDWMQFNKVYEASSKLNDYYWATLEDNYNNLENAIFVNLIDEIDSHNKISNSELLDCDNAVYVVDESKKDGFIKLNEKSILLLNPSNNDSTGLDSISFTNFQIKELKKEYLNEIKTKFINQSKEREM